MIISENIIYVFAIAPAFASHRQLFGWTVIESNKVWLKYTWIWLECEFRFTQPCIILISTDITLHRLQQAKTAERARQKKIDRVNHINTLTVCWILAHKDNNAHKHAREYMNVHTVTLTLTLTSCFIHTNHFGLPPKFSSICAGISLATFYPSYIHLLTFCTTFGSTSHTLDPPETFLRQNPSKWEMS